MNIEKYAKQVLVGKGLEITEENLNYVCNALNRRFNKKYNAVCIGIDKTLLDGKEISYDTLATIYKLLKKHISVVLMTGRGEKGLKEFNSVLCENLIQKFNIQQELLKNIIGVSHNGDFLFYTFGDNNFLDTCNLLVEEKELDNLKNIQSDLNNFFVKKLADIELITSFCDAYGKVAAFRILLKETKQIDKIEQYLKEFIELEIKN